MRLCRGPIFLELRTEGVARLSNLLLSNLLSARSLPSHREHRAIGSIKDAARDGPCAHGKSRARKMSEQK